MMLNPAYILDDLLNRHRISDAPTTMDGDTSPKHAWKMGYLAAIEDCCLAFGVIGPKPTEEPKP